MLRRRARIATPSPPACLLAAGAALATLPSLAGAHDEPARVLSRLDSEISPHALSAEGALERAEFARLAGDLEAALKWAAAARRAGAGETSVRLLEAAVALDGGAPGRARAALDEVLAREPHHAPALRLRARARLACGDPVAAAEDLRAFLALHPRAGPDPWVEYAELRFLGAAGDPAAAAAALEEGLHHLGPIPDVVLRLARWEASAGRVESALARLATLPQSLHATGRVAWERALILESAGRLLEAQAAFTEALDALATLSRDRRRTPAAAALEAAVRDRLAPVPSPRPEDE